MMPNDIAGQKPRETKDQQEFGGGCLHERSCAVDSPSHLPWRFVMDSACSLTLLGNVRRREQVYVAFLELVMERKHVDTYVAVVLEVA